MAEIPCDHFINFPPEWWTDRRRRDYFIDDSNRVRLRADSPTGLELSKRLRKIAQEIAGE